VPRIADDGPWVSAIWSRSNHGEDRLRRDLAVAARSGEGPFIIGGMGGDLADESSGTAMVQASN